MDVKTLSNHIQLIYEQAINPDGWNVILEQLVVDLELRSGAIGLERIDRSHVYQRISKDFPEEQTKQLLAYFHKLDVWTQNLREMPKGIFYDSDNEVMSRNLKKTEFYNDYLKPFDTGYAAGGFIDTNDKHGIRFSFHHTHKQGPLTDKTHYLNMLAPHLKRASKIKQHFSELNSQVQSLTLLVDKLPMATLVTDENEKVHYHNHPAEELFTCSNEISLTNNKLIVPPNHQKKLKQLVSSAINASQGDHTSTQASSLKFICEGGSILFKVEVQPFHGFTELFGLQYQKSLALIFIEVEEINRSIDFGSIAAKFSFTRKEAELAQALVQGKSIPQISKEYSRSKNTLRTHLKSIFAKTNCNSQSQLILKLYSKSPLDEI